MAQEQAKLFSYGPVDIQQDPSTQELHIFHADMSASATLARDDPLHQEVLQTIEQNPYSKGFIANQVSALMENQDRWTALELDQEGLSFGPSQEVQQQVEQNATLDRFDEIAKEQERYWNARGISSTEAAKLQETVEREGLDDAPVQVVKPDVIQDIGGHAQPSVLETQKTFLQEHPPLPLPDSVLDGLSEEHRKQVSNPRIKYRAYAEKEGSRFRSASAVPIPAMRLS